MSVPIEQRIVGIQFENKQFESGIKDSLGSLDKLKKGLDLEGASKSLSGLTTASNRFSLAGMASGIDAISSKFSALGVMGITALVNLTNAAVNAGKQIVSSLTIDPISAGFKEYEQGLSAFQTIQANTAGATASVSQKALNGIKNAADAATQASLNGQAASLEGLRKSQTQQVRSYQKTADSQLKILSDTQEKASTALDKSIKNETKSLQTAHDAKLVLYNTEYMAKLKVIDEERYNKIKAIDDEIAGINNLTKAEEEILKIADEKKKLAELQTNIDNTTDASKLKELQTNIKIAKTVSARTKAEQVLADYTIKTTNDRKKAEQVLAEYKTKLTREQLLEVRTAQIDNLNISKDTITNEYDLKMTQLESEYTAKTASENKLYAITSENLQAQQAERQKALSDSQKRASDNLREQQSDIRNAMSDNQAAAMSGLQNQQKVSLSNIEERKAAEIKALQEVARATKINTSEEDINKALTELNDYANKTIYSFGQMTTAVGSWTARGVGLKDSVSGIKGIYNLIAMVGSTATQAQSAITQLGQKIKGGTVLAMDWMSAESAGISGGLEKQAIVVARNQGVAIDELMAKYGTFRASLEAGWFTSDILLESLKQFAGEYSDEQLRSMGYNDEQIAQIQELGKTALESATVLKSYSQTMDMLKSNMATGWATTFKLLIGNLGEAKILWTAVGTSIGGAMQSSTDARNSMLSDWAALGGRQILIEGLVNAFDALVAIITPIKEAFREFFPAMTGRDLYDLTYAFKNFTEKLKMGEETAKKVKEIFRGLFAVLDIGKQAVVAVYNGVKTLISAFLPAGEGILSFAASIGTWLVSLDEASKKSGTFQKVVQTLSDFIVSIAKYIQDAIGPLEEFVKKFSEGFNKVWNVVKIIGGYIWTGIKFIFDKLGEVFGGFDSGNLKDLAEGGLLVTLAVGITKFFNMLDSLGKTGKGFLKAISGILDGVKNSLNAFALDIKAGALLKIAIAIGILAAALVVLSMIDQAKLGVALGAVTAMLVELIGSLKLIGGKGDPSLRAVIAIGGIATALLILSSAMEKMSKLSWDEIARGMTALILMSGLLILVAKAMEKSEKSIIKSAASFLIFSIGLTQLATGLRNMIGVIQLMGSIDKAQLTQGLIGLGVLLAELLVFTKVSKIEKMGVKQGLGMIAFAFGLSLLYKSVEQFAMMDQGKLTQGLIAIGALLTSIGLFLNAADNGKDVLLASIGLVAIGGAMLIFAKVVEQLGGLSIEVLAKGLGSMAIALAAVTASLYFMPDDALLKAGAIVAVSVALVIIAKALGMMGSMDLWSIIKGLIAMGGALAIMVVAINMLSNPKNLLGAAAMVIVAGALLVLAKVLTILGAMSLEQIGLALLALAGVFVIVWAAVLVLGPSIGIIMGLAGAIALIGLSVLAVGAGLLLFSAGLAALAISGAAGGAVFIGIVAGVIALIPLFMAALAAGLVAFIVIIGSNAPILASALKKLFLALIDVIITIIPATLAALLVWIKGLLDTLVTAIPMLVDAGMKLLLGLMKGLAKNIGGITQAGIDIVVNFVNALASRVGDVIDAAFNFVIKFIQGLADAIRTKHMYLENAVWDLVTAIINALGSMGGRLVEAGKNIIVGMIEGIKQKALALGGAALEAAKSMVNAILNFLGIGSPSKVFRDIGKYSIDGLVVGLTTFGSRAVTAATDVGSNVVTSLGNAMSGIPAIIDGNIDMSPTIRPILDLTNVQAGATQLDAMLNKDKTISVDETTSKAEAAAKSQNSQNQLINDIRKSMTDLKDSVTAAFDKLVEPVPQINFNGTYQFAGEEDIDYFMNAAALLVQRRKA